MKLFNWFRKKKEVEEVDFFELSKWLWENLSVIKDLKLEFTEFNRLLEEIKLDLQQLKQVNVDDARVEKKLKDLVKGNLPAYVNAVEIFLKTIKVPEKFDEKSVKSFVENLEKSLDEFNKKTFRNFHIIQNLVGDELLNVVKKIKQLDDVKAKIKKIQKSGKLILLDKLQNELDDVYSYVYEKHEQRFEKLLDQKNRLIEKEKKLSKLKHELENSNDFKEYNENLVKLENVKAEVYAIESLLKGDFSVLARPLRLLNKGKIAESAIVEDPVKFLINDVDKILASLDGLRKNVDNINIKNKDRVEAVLRSLNKNTLQHYKEKILRLQNEQKRIEKELQNSNYKTKEIKLKREIEEVLHEIELLDEKISKFKKKDLNSIVQNIKQMLESLGVNIKLKNVPVD
ncbi:hypothetical protein D6777_02725 [Candidatus Woesearchaeota archaeon]|nr:MAG: hypothetical protein D6777_02725 [Candidatus Woesearchaeota archaeon]